MKKLSGGVFFFCLLMLGGIADGLCEGASLTTVLWSIPIMFVMSRCKA